MGSRRAAEAKRYAAYRYLPMRSKLYLISFSIVFAVFGAANYYSYARMPKNDWGLCDDCFISFGFPFAVWIAGGFAGTRSFLWYGIIGDLAIAILCGIVLSWALSKVLSRRPALETRGPNTGAA